MPVQTSRRLPPFWGILASQTGLFNSGIGFRGVAVSQADFCNGRLLVNPFLRHPLAGNLLLYGIGAVAVA
jgi:hypothetical protein